MKNEVDRIARKGDHIKIVSAVFNFDHYKNGDIKTVTKVDELGNAWFRSNSTPSKSFFAAPFEYVVLKDAPREIITYKLFGIPVFKRTSEVAE